MKKQKPNAQTKSSKEGYLIIPNSFLREGVSKLGIGPALLYLELLTYCHKGKNIAWPTLTTLSNQLGISKNSLLSYRKILLGYGLIKKIVKRRNCQSNFYQVTPIEGAKNELRQVQNLGEGSANIAPGVVQNLHPNNNHLNNSHITTTTKDVVVDFKKLKEEGEEKMLVLKERLRDLDFTESFMEKILKDYSPKKIEEKLDLLREKRNIRSPAGWLAAALKNDYREEEETAEGNGNLPFPIPSPPEGEGPGEGKKILSPEEAIRRFRLLRHRL
jgi:hypothetical protein